MTNNKNTSNTTNAINIECYRCCLSMSGIACLAIAMSQWAMVLIRLLICQVQSTYFAVAVRAELSVSFILLAIITVVTPKFAEVYAQSDLLRLKQVHLASMDLMAFISVPILFYY